MFEEPTTTNPIPVAGNQRPSATDIVRSGGKSAPPTNLPVMESSVSPGVPSENSESAVKAPAAPVAPEIPKRAEDMFAGSGLDRPVAPVGGQSSNIGQPNIRLNQSVLSSDQIQTMPQGPIISDLEPKVLTNSKKAAIIILSLVIVGGLAAGGFLAYKRFFSESEPKASGELELQNQIDSAPVDLEVPSADNEFVEPEVNETITNQEPAVPEELVPAAEPAEDGSQAQLPPSDRDGDGLTDAEESALGTNSEAPDTDSDGLSDLDEVKIYKTDPLNPDTDRDGYFDGLEVRDGYNPNGPGRLLNLPG